MEDEKYQKELFEFEKPKRIFPRLSGLFPKADFDNRISITLTLERVVFIVIGLIMAMIIIYAFGVEMGKRMSQRAVSSESRISLVKVPQIQVPAITVRPIAVKTVAVKPYTISAATFSHKEYAVQEMNRMRKAGFDSFLTQNANLFRLCVGAYANKDAAQNDLIKVRRMYKDAFVKVR